jgi:hypothetical protein
VCDLLFLSPLTPRAIQEHRVRQFGLSRRFPSQGSPSGLVCLVKWQMVPIGSSSLGPGRFISRINPINPSRTHTQDTLPVPTGPIPQEG